MNDVLKNVKNEENDGRKTPKCIIDISAITQLMFIPSPEEFFHFLITWNSVSRKFIPT